ncbi:hypothetical protein EVAR_36579_1 [Eumeta japonica]|uniref:Uncharacterized protein n=1 Tax=Eumeta variegata TaxID=151549 RepID=A0A4C1XRZ8_EUMVA|nr:hypothetical protein EVAR_36579_1 [Eumeta japonica]
MRNDLAVNRKQRFVYQTLACKILGCRKYSKRQIFRLTCFSRPNRAVSSLPTPPMHRSERDELRTKRRRDLIFDVAGKRFPLWNPNPGRIYICLYLYMVDYPRPGFLDGVQRKNIRDPTSQPEYQSSRSVPSRVPQTVNCTSARRKQNSPTERYAIFRSSKQRDRAKGPAADEGIRVAGANCARQLCFREMSVAIFKIVHFQLARYVDADANNGRSFIRP